ncbi:DUF3006 domain-containing protein [Sporosarcina aquimarina]|uniref:DUF3006 domain-containing protein n=1 Tax=Sporosarcina aquimarina TaxID=114975 RepID=A0ABU4G2D8_9BACL|nr:DUF3006 domain-containing protein [Sporosarcina aquimarina]MDW0111129.1 DUF3006 domain-containing protein [Sporosarcina aquimarina]
MMNTYTIDRFEGEYAVLLVRDNEKEQVLVLKKQIPFEACEGDILQISFVGNGKEVGEVIMMNDKTKSVKEKTEALIQKLLDKNK